MPRTSLGKNNADKEEHYNHEQSLITFKVLMMVVVVMMNIMMITFKVLSSLLIISMPSEFPVLLLATIFSCFVT